MDKQKKILSLNGGGVRGIFTISILARLEEHIEKKSDEKNVKIGDYFDLISGASIGGILAIGLANGLSARELKNILQSHAKKIFPTKWYSYIPLLGGKISVFLSLIKTRYEPGPLRKAVIEAVGENSYVKGLKRRIVIPVVNISAGTPSVIKTKHKPNWGRDDKYNLIDVAMATSAAPTYFPPHKINESYHLDGGLVANDASLIAIHEAQHFLNWDINALSVLNVGTMSKKMTVNHNKIKWWKGGYLFLWGGGDDLINIILSANQSLHSFMAQQSLPNKDHYFLLDDHITPDQDKSLTLDNASKESLEMLISRANNVCDYAIDNENLMRTFFSEKADEFIHPDTKKMESSI